MTTTLRARLARVGFQQYEGRVEHRSDREVFHPAALAGLEGLRIQRGHEPAEGRSVGRVVPGSVRRDGQHVAAVLELHDAATVRDLQSGELTGEISLAYQAEVIQDAAGQWHQTNIRFEGPGAHVALLGRRERARCGATCSITKDSMSNRVERHSDGVILDAQECTCGSGPRVDGGDTAERDKIQAYLDHYSELHGVHQDAIVSEVIRVHGGKVTASKILIADAAGRLNGPVNGRAVYVDGTRTARPAPANHNDAAFRGALAAKDRADGFEVSGTDPDAERKVMLAGLEESKRLANEHSAQTGEPDTDAAFRRRLAKQLEST